MTNLTTPSSWADLRQRSQSVELFIMMLMWNRVTPTAQRYNLPALVAAIGPKQVSFSVGSMTPCAAAPCTPCPAGVGTAAASTDFLYLSDWLAAGGRIEEIVLDNPYRRLLLRDPLAPPGPLTPAAMCPLSYVATEIADYFARIRVLLPGVRLVLTDGLAQFFFPGHGYAPTVPGYRDAFADYLQAVQTRAQPRDAGVHAFAIDYMDALEFDALAYPGSAAIIDRPAVPYAGRYVENSGADFGRLLATEAVLRAQQVKVTTYVNAYPRMAATDDADVEGDVRGTNRTTRFLAGYAAAGGRPDAWRFIFWQRYPEPVGPETRPVTALRTMRDGVRMVTLPVETPGAFRSDTSVFDLFLAAVEDPPVRTVPWNRTGTPLAGDWDGDGVATPGVYEPATAVFRLTNSSTLPASAELQPFTFGNPASGFIPLAGDWDGNGSDSVGLYDSATSTFYLRNSNSSGIADTIRAFGAAGLSYLPLAGDWDGDGRDTIGLYELSSRSFYLWTSHPQGFADVTLTSNASPGMLPFVGDWDGDGRDTPGLWNPTSTTWESLLFNRSSSGALDVATPDERLARPKSAAPGATGVVPLSGRWVRTR